MGKLFSIGFAIGVGLTPALTMLLLEFMFGWPNLADEGAWRGGMWAVTLLAVAIGIVTDIGSNTTHNHFSNYYENKKGVYVEKDADAPL